MHWFCWLALVTGACAASEPTRARSEPGPVLAAPAVSSPEEPAEQPDASFESNADAAPPPAPAPAPEPAGPNADNPGWSEVADVGNEKLADGFYFVDGTVSEVPCRACPPPPMCKPGGNCPKSKECSFCQPRLTIEDSGKSLELEFGDRLTVPKFQKKQRVRVVFEKRGTRRAFVRQSKACPPSECLETDPPMKLDRAPKGTPVRREGARCYAKLGCAPNAKCDPDRESRVRCP